MNKKLIAAAVSAAVVAPVAAYGEATVYGSIRNAIDLNDVSSKPDADGTTDISGVSSRFGIKYSQEMGNGLTAHGKYEFATTTDKEKANKDDPKEKDDDAAHGTSGGVEDTRVATVGISGAFGRVDVGNQWSSYFNTFGSLISPTYTLGYYLYTGVGGGLLRSSNTIKYSNSYGPLSFQLDVRLNGSGESGDVAEAARGDGIGLGLRFAVNDNLTIAVAFDNETGAEDNSVTAGVAPAPGVASSIGDFNTVTGNRDQDGNTAAAVISTAAERTAYAALSAPERADYIATLIANNPGLDKDDFTGYTAAVNGNPKNNADSPDTDRVGISAKYTFGGGYWASLGWQNYTVDENERTGDGEVDVNTTFLYVGGDFSEKTNWLVGYSTADDGRDAVARVYPVAPVGNTAGTFGVEAVTATDDSSQLTWGVYHNLGGGLKLFYESASPVSENKSWDGSRHLLGMRVNF